ncbi:MAG: TonB-dependent receptor [Vicinamibacterales bacterium]
MRGLTRVVLVSLLCFVASPALGQSPFSTIRGTVRDPQRAIVPGARVTVVDDETGVAHSTDTNVVGDYEVTGLRGGRYRVEARAPGFKAFERRGAVLLAGEPLRIDVALEVGAQSDTLIVTARSAPIRLESQSVQAGLETRQLQTLPRNARDIQNFLFLTPNVVGGADGNIQFIGARSWGAAYVQDGQPSTNPLFGNLTAASPSIEAIAEVKVQSGSYNAETGGLASVVVTTRRGGNVFSGLSFLDGNADELNALTYPQKQAGLERGFVGSNTSDRQYGVTVGGPIKRNRTFVLASFEGARRTSVGGGGIVNVPTARMRAGDFSANTFIVRDPRTGLPFPGNVIPSDRIHPAAKRMLDLFYPSANLTPLSNGVGRSQQFVNLRTERDRGDLRVDHELSSRDSLVARGSWQGTDPGTTFEDARFPNLGVFDRRLESRTVTGAWTRQLSSRAVNELRTGYVTDRSNRRSTFVAADVAANLGLEIPTTGLGRRGYPAFTFQGSNAIRGIADNSANANRNQRASTFSVGNTLSWLPGRHALKVGGQWNRHMVTDGFSVGVTGAVGSYVFSGAATGNSFSDFLLGLPARADVGINARGLRPLDVSANDVALFAQDDWKVSSALTVFLGARYEVSTNFVERNDLLANFDPTSSSLVLPSPATAQALAPEALRLPVKLADEVGVGRSLVKTDIDNIAPRVGFAYRPGSDNRTVIRGGFGRFFPTSAAQGIRDALSRPAFRFANVRTAPDFAHAFTTGTPSSRSLFGVNAVALDLESPEAYEYNLTFERELPAAMGVRVSYLATQYRKLLVNRDINTVPPSTVAFDLSSPTDRLRLPFPGLDPFLNRVENAGTGHFRALQIEGRRRPLGGLGFGVAYTLAGSESTAPDLGNATLGVVQYAPYNLELDRGPDPHVTRHRLILDATWELPYGSASARPWVRGLASGWTLSTVVQARSGYFLTPFFRYETDQFPANTGKAYDTNGSFDEAWRPDIVGDPTGPQQRDGFFNLDAFRLPAPGQVGNAPRGIIEGPGAFVANLGVYKRIARAGRVSVEFRATIDNLFDTPQFLVSSTSDFLDLTDYLVNGVRDNGVTNVLNEVGSLEGFASARVVRLGVRVTF